MLAKAEEQGHQSFPLPPALALWDGVDFTTVIFPQISRRLAIKSSDERQNLLAINHTPQPFHHGVPRDEVECPDTVNRDDGSVGIQISENLEDVGDCLAPSFRLECVLMGCRGRFHLFGVLLRYRPSDYSPEDISHNDASHPTIRFSQCGQPSASKSVHDFFWNPVLCQQQCGVAQCSGNRIVFE